MKAETMKAGDKVRIENNRNTRELGIANFSGIILGRVPSIQEVYSVSVLPPDSEFPRISFESCRLCERVGIAAHNLKRVFK